MCEIKPFPSPVIDKKHPLPKPSTCVFDYDIIGNFLYMAAYFTPSQQAAYLVRSKPNKRDFSKTLTDFLSVSFVQLGLSPDTLIIDYCKFSTFHTISKELTKKGVQVKYIKPHQRGFQSIIRKFMLDLKSMHKNIIKPI